MNVSTEISKNEQPQAALENSTNVTHPQTNIVPRALHAIQDFDPSFESIFNNRDLFKLITVDCNFQNFLTFRLISQTMCEIMRFFLKSEVKISFWFRQLLSTSRLVEDKWSFTQRETPTVYIIRSVAELVSDSYNNKTENLNFVLKIDNINEINDLNQVLLLNANTSFDPIQGLDLKNISIDSSNIQLISEFLSTIANTIASGLLGLSIGYVGTDLELPNNFNKLESLYILSVNHSIEIKLPKSLPKLKSFAISSISYNSIINFPICLENLTICVIGNLYTPFELPELPSLKKLSIGGLLIHADRKNMNPIQYCGWLVLPKSLPSLEDLSINQIDDNVPFHLDCQLDNLKTLLFGTIGWHVTIKLMTPLDNLTSLSFQNLHSDTILELPPSLASLNIFSIRWLQNNAKINFPPILNNFETLLIGDIEELVNIGFQGLLPKFRSLNITSIQNNTSFQLPDALANIKELSIQSLGCRSSLILPALLAHLSHLTINDVSFNAICDLSTVSLPSLQALNLPKNEYSSIIILPKELNNLSSFHIANIVENTVLPNWLNALTHLTVGNMKNNNFQFPSLPNLQHFKIHVLESQLILPQFEHLKSLIIEKIYWGGGINLQPFPELETLMIGENNNASTNLAFLLPKLVQCSIGKLRSYDSFALPDLSNNFNDFSFHQIENDQLCTIICSLQNLTTLSINTIYKGLSLVLPQTIGNIESFNINYISSKATIALPNSILTLKDLSIGIICKNATLKLPDSLQELETLKLEDTDIKGLLEYLPSSEAINYDNFISKFLCSLPNLKNLYIQKISAATSLILPPSLFNLQSLTISTISNKVNFTLTSLDSIKNLKKLTINYIKEKAHVTIAGAFNNLEILHLGDMESKSRLSFSDCSFDNLTTLMLGNINSSISLADSLCNIQKIIISEVSCIHFHFPSTLDNLTTLEIDFLPNYNTQFVLPEFLPNLTNLTINGYKATLQLPSLTHATKSFFINSRDANTNKLLHLVNSCLIPPINLQ